MDILKKMDFKIIPFSYSEFFVNHVFETVVVFGFWFISYFSLLCIYFFTILKINFYGLSLTFSIGNAAASDLNIYKFRALWIHWQLG